MNVSAQVYGWQYTIRQWFAGRYYRIRHRRGARPVFSQDADRVLLIIAGLIGDTVMSTPVILEARRLWPRARITVLGQRHNRELLCACPLIDDCVISPTIPFSLRNRRKTGELKAWLRQQGFDLAIIVLGDQFALALAEVGIPVRVGVRGHLLEPCLTHTYDIGSPCTWGPSQRLGALRTLGCDVRDVLPRLWVSDAARDEARRRLGALGLPDKAPYAVVHPFGRTPRQWWPLERVAELAEGLWSRHGLRTVVIGGPATRGQVPTSGGNTMVDATGVLGIQELLGAVQDARLAVSTDSGPFHIAGALGRPLVGLFRARRPEHANHYPQARVVFGQDSTCERHCRWDHCQTLPCRQLGALPVAEVLGAVRLAQRNSPLRTTRKRAERSTADTCEPYN